MRLSFETFLLEANRRGWQQKKKIYCHVVGLGLGVWQLQGYQNQTKHFFDVFEESLDNLLKNSNIDHLSDVDFSWVDPPVDAVFKLSSQVSKIRMFGSTFLEEIHLQNMREKR